MKRFSALMFTCLFLTLNAQAWNAVGHKLVADIAYQQLNPEVQLKVDKLTHYLSREYHRPFDFKKLAAWPDTLRSQKIETFTHWHYIDQAFTSDGTPLKNLTDTDNAVWAINKIEPVVQNDYANRFERARFLAFLVHIVGDIHQPLHASSRISAKLPEGDKGGNLYFIHYPANSRRTISLHKLWDGGFGLFNVHPSENITSLSQQIMTRYPETYFGDQARNLKPEVWALEGFKMAEQFVYSTAENGWPTDDYVARGKDMVQQRIALSGYRLGHLLNELLGNG